MGNKRKNKLSINLSDFGSGPGNAYANVLEEMFYRDRIKATWKNLGELASRMYDEPADAFEILQRNSGKTTKTINLKRFHLTIFIEDQRDKKINKGKGLRTIIGENLESCCKLINIFFDDVGSSKTQMNENRKLRSKTSIYTFDQIVERIDRKYRRVIEDPEVKKEFKKWQKEEFNRKELTDFLK
jgi:hypothetical protein